MNYFSFLFVVALSFFAKTVFSEQQIIGFAFDLDDNILKMPTSIVLFEKQTGEPLPVSTDEFAVIRELIGKSGTPWASFSIDPCPEKGSLRFFGDLSIERENHFLKDLKKALEGSPHHWQGPAWSDFSLALSDPHTAQQTSIITARNHEPSTVFEGLKLLKERGLILHLLPEDNIWTVSAPSFKKKFQDTFDVVPPVGTTQSPSERKAAVAEGILDQINQLPLRSNSYSVLDPEGNHQKPLHLWGFSDDDFGTFQKMQAHLQKGVDSNRWPFVKITLFFTGLNHPQEKPRSVVLRPHRDPRSFREEGEWKGFIRNCFQSLAKVSGVQQ